MPKTVRPGVVPCITLVVLAACGTGRTEPAPKTVTLTPTDFAVTVTAPAELRAARETTIHSGMEGKRTVIQLVRDNALVEQGDVLVELDASGLRDKRAEQAIALARADGALARAETDPERSALEAEIEIRRERLAHLDGQIGRAVVRAPIPGIVLHARGIREGSVVRELQPLLHMADLGSLQARVRARPDDLGRIRVGQPASVRVDVLPDVEVAGSVATIEPADASGERWVVVDLATHEPGLRPSMSANAAIEVDRLRDVLTVPLQSIRLEGGSPTVWRQGARGVEPVAVEVGAGDGARVVVRGGLGAGDRILLAPPTR